MIRAVIVDDEPPARTKLRQLLAHESDISIISECANGPEAVLAVRDERPDLLFLDIQMPDMDGFEVIRQLGTHVPAVIFVTAYDQHAIQAFDVNALDYLLKPVGAERFHAALQRAREHISKPGNVDDRLLALLDGSSQRPRYLTRLIAREVGRATLIPTDQIEWIESADNYARVHWHGGAIYVRMTMKELERGLDPELFLRVHRTAIVAISRIVALEPSSHGEYHVVLTSGQKIPASRTYAQKLRTLIQDAR